MSNRGARNLILLGIGASLISLATTAISLAIYHYSGDIYLDRSRPGFLPDEQEEEEREEQVNSRYTFTDHGDIDAVTLDEYLDHFKTPKDTLDQLKDPFSADALSDESIGLPSAQKSENS